MSEKQNPVSEEMPTPPFRWNSKVLQIVALLIVALALPVTIAILGIRGLRNASSPAPEMDGLRGALETVVDSKWKEPFLEGAVRTATRAVANGDACLKTGDDVQVLARDCGGSVLAPERIEEGGTRWLVQVPADRKAAFEAGLAARGFSPVVGEAAGDPVFYSLEIRILP
jgi:hypothetical protein